MEYVCQWRAVCTEEGFNREWLLATGCLQMGSVLNDGIVNDCKEH